MLERGESVVPASRITGLLVWKWDEMALFLASIPSA